MTTSIAAGAEPAPVWVWYRTSEGCPDGEAFVSRLAELGKVARLARVGDRVDFVVTLGSDSNESSGRLERQTRGGIVAIREYRDARCEQVAEALALTLDLALEPDAPSTTDRARTADSHAAPAETPGVASRAPAAIAIGAQGTIATGTAPGVPPGAALFVYGHTGSDWLASWRGTLLGAHRESTAQERVIDVLLLGGRIEGCPVEARVDLLSLSPCLGLDAGLLRATGPDALGIADVGFWSAIVAHGRVAARLGAGLSLELQGGASCRWSDLKWAPRTGRRRGFAPDPVASVQGSAPRGRFRDGSSRSATRRGREVGTAEAVPHATCRGTLPFESC